MMRSEWAEAETLRDEGQAAATHAADPRVMLAVDKVIAEAVESRQPFSANDIRDRLPVTSRGLVGARVNAVVARRPAVVEKVGEVTSNLGSTHAKKIAVWRGVA